MATIQYYHFLAPIMVMLAGLLPVIIYKQKLGTYWKIFLVGALAWLGSVAAKVVFAIIFNPIVANLLLADYPTLYHIYIGLLTGVFEIVIPLLIIIKLKKSFKKTNDQIGFGLGFGSFEALVLGGLRLIGFLYMLAVAEPLTQLAASILPTSGLGAVTYSSWEVLERLSATMVHITSNFLLFAFVFFGKKRYLVYSIVYKTVVDGLFSYFFIAGASQAVMQPSFLVLGLLGLGIVAAVMRKHRLKMK